MIQMFVTNSIATRSLLDLEEHDPRGILLRDRLNGSGGSRPATLPGIAEASPKANSQVESAVIDSRAIEEDTRVAPTAVWSALKAALVIFAVYIVAATLLATVVFAPGLKLLGCFVALAVMTFAGLPMLLASISVAAEDATAQELLHNSNEHERLGT
jgi:hypothetical protein